MKMSLCKLPSVGGGQWHTRGRVGGDRHRGEGGSTAWRARSVRGDRRWSRRARRSRSVRGDGGGSWSARRSRSRVISGGGHWGRSRSGHSLCGGGLARLELDVKGVRGAASLAEGRRAADAARLGRLPSRDLGGLGARRGTVVCLDLDVDDAVAARASLGCDACARGASRPAADACGLNIIVASLDLSRN
jgi:hypothetical protein